MTKAIKILGNAIGSLPVLGAFFKVLYQREQDIKKANHEMRKRICKHFRVEIRETFWGRRKDLIERDKPLTDKELSEYGY